MVKFFISEIYLSFLETPYAYNSVSPKSKKEEGGGGGEVEMKKTRMEFLWLSLVKAIPKRVVL